MKFQSTSQAMFKKFIFTSFIFLQLLNQPIYSQSNGFEVVKNLELMDQVFQNLEM